jgi:hypothetical protein
MVLLTQNSLSTTPANHWVLPGDPRGVSAEFGNLYTADYAHTNADAAAAGFDAVFAYHVPTFTDLMVSPTPTDAQVLSEQSQAWANWLSFSALPTVVTASVGWNAAPWKENDDSWRLTPTDWGTLLSQAKSALAARSHQGTGSVLLLDNWNEYAEGHDIAPTAQDGYTYLDAVGAAFSPGWPAKVPASIDTLPVKSAIPQLLGRNGQPR